MLGKADTHNSNNSALDSVFLFIFIEVQKSHFVKIGHLEGRSVLHVRHTRQFEAHDCWSATGTYNWMQVNIKFQRNDTTKRAKMKWFRLFEDKRYVSLIVRGAPPLGDAKGLWTTIALHEAFLR